MLQSLTSHMIHNTTAVSSRDIQEQYMSDYDELGSILTGYKCYVHMYNGSL